ncbi:MAG: pyruvate, phosphate dikinase, partial [bacterium]|nr:pyruvate, phosphate dikinase [bacterium]
MSKQWVYLFTEGGKEQKELLGGKGANLAEMTKAGMPVPPGFTISTEACAEFYKLGAKLPEGVWEQSLVALKTIEEQTGKKFGVAGATNPLLVSVRSGAVASMPGMMDTVLNLGLNPATVQGLATLTSNERFAYDAYRRFIHMFANVVMGVEKTKFEKKLTEIKEAKGVSLDTDLDVNDLKKVIELYFQVYQEETHEDFPTDPLKQLELSLKAVFGSWNNKRAIEYRRFNRLEGLAGTAVNIQAMVFGNMGDDSGTGVAFTRDPATGEKMLYGEYLTNAQGEDVVAGIRTPKKIAELEQQMPVVYQQFVEITQKLEKHYRDMQDMEFTIEKGKLYMLQTRNGKRTAQAAVKIAFEMVGEGLISKKEALMRVTPENVDQLLHPRLDPKAQLKVIAKGINASPGAASGKAVFDADKAADMGRDGEKVILVRAETNPDDIHGMIQAKGILTQHGGATSHAAVVARGIGKPCVAGCEGLRVDEEKREFKVGEVVVKEGDLISINGSTGEVILGEVPMIAPEMSEDLKALLAWADEERKLGVWTNADYPRDAKKALEFGAEGIGLCRTEHMFFEEERRPIVVKMIMAETDEERQKCLDQLFEFQKKDFEGIF